ncbi:MAG: hypothetical protein QXI16_00200 [Sulfolobaceae archaeon]
MNKKLMSVFIVLMLLISGLVFIGFSNEVNAQTSPLYQYPITFTNSPSGSGSYQQLINLTMSSYNINTTSIDNFLFSYTNGTFIYAWIESYNSTTLTVWLNLLNGTTEIYLDVYSLTTNEFSNTSSYLGEAPQLSPTYGEYDNGALVFPFYYNFAGTSLSSSWTPFIQQGKSAGTTTVDNGLTLTGGDGWWGYNSTYQVSAPSIIEWYGEQEATGGYGPFAGTYTGVFFEERVGDSPSRWGIDYTNNGVTSEVNYTGTSVVNTTYLVSGYYVSGNQLLYTNYTTEQVSGNVTLGTSNLVIGSYQSSTSYFQWIRVRTYLPNGMPSYTIAPSYTVTVNESGLPSNTVWYFNLTNGQSYSTNTSSLSFFEVNGTYDYYANSTNILYSTAPSSFTVNGSNVVLNITFSEQEYNVTFEESGFNMNGTNLWYLNVSIASTGATYGNFSSNTSTITFEAPNGTYNFTIGESESVVYTTIYNQNSFTVNGQNVFIYIPFEPAYYLTVNGYNDVPSYPDYAINTTIELLNYVNNTTAIDDYLYVNQTQFLNGQQYTVPEGNYSITFYFVDTTGATYYLPDIYNITVNQNMTFNLNFTEIYNVSFVESGLPANTTWYINITNGNSYSSNTTTINFQLPNGTYYFTQPVQSASNYLGYTNVSAISINGNSVNISIEFNEIYYFNITENGLPNGTEWQVIIYYITSTNYTEFATLTSNTTVIPYYLPNGTYVFNASTSYENMLAPSVNSTVNGSAPNVTINFLTTYLVTVTESGLTLGTVWYFNVTLNGTVWGNYVSNTTTIEFYAYNGTYNYTISDVSTTNFAILISNMTFTVNGSAVYVNFTAYPLYNAIFIESGLPSNTTWNFNMSMISVASFYVPAFTNYNYYNQSYVVTSTSLTVPNLLDGVYYYQAYATNYLLINGTFTVENSNVTIDLTFNFVNAINFVESGLPANYTWSVSLTDYANDTTNTITTTSNTITFSNYTNGNYYYLATATYYAMISNIIELSTENMTIDLQFTTGYNVTIYTSGLAYNTEWNINVTEYGTSSYFVYTTNSPNLEIIGLQSLGTTNFYIFTASANGYNTVTGEFYVDANNTSLIITFYQSTTPVNQTTNNTVSSSGLLMFEQIALLVAIIIVMTITAYYGSAIIGLTVGFIMLVIGRFLLIIPNWVIVAVVVVASSVVAMKLYLSRDNGDEE